MPIQLSTALAPLLITTARGAVTAEEYRLHIDDCTKRMLGPGRPYAYVYDATQMQLMTAGQRKMQGEWIEEHKALIARLNKGCGFAFESALVRGYLTAVHWFAPPPYPYSVHAMRAQAIAWCTRQLEAAGLTVPTAERAA